MDLGAISARKSAPNDGTDPFTNTLGQQAYARSKQNSDAAGMKYQGFRKDPFTFACNSSKYGSGYYESGKYPVKIYNDKSELIYQEDRGGSNLGKTPVGGVIVQYSVASSMMETVKRPNTFYYASPWTVISQAGHSKELFNYYWTSYSRGTDGNWDRPKWHNTYLDGYIVLRSKSIYDPCPYGYRTPTNGIYSDFTSNPGWAQYSYTGGAILVNTWFTPSGYRNPIFTASGCRSFFLSSTVCSSYHLTSFLLQMFTPNPSHTFEIGIGQTVRCIEDATVKADQSEAYVTTHLRLSQKNHAPNLSNTTALLHV